MTKKEFITTVEVAWSLTLPDITIPNIKILSSWYRWYSIEIVLTAIEEAAGYIYRKGITDPDAVGRIASGIMRKIQAKQLAEGGSGYEPPFPQQHQ